MSLLAVQDIRVNYGDIEALRGVSFEVVQSEIVGIIGRNGAGKTTTLRGICGLNHPRSGRITFMGKAIDHLAPHAIVDLGIAYVPEGRRIFTELTVLENLKLGAFRHFRHGARKTAMETLEREFARFPVLRGKKAQLGGTLSGGEQQILAISRALMSSPGFLLLDEPSMGLAPIMVSNVLDAILALREEGLTVLLVEQKAYLTLKMVDRAYVLTNGRITLSGQGSVLLNDEEVKAAYLGQRQGR
jgi:branched-chain amino acid transport system ATP-binding protein